MQIEINNGQSIAEIKTQFNNYFPYLKLEFFTQPHCEGEASSLKFKISPHKILQEFRRTTNTSSMNILPEMTVADLEQQLGNEFGIGVQVFRKSGGIWLETILTDSWTLFEQNKQGEMLNSKIENDSPENFSDSN